MFSKILQKSQENTCAWVSFLIKLQAEACNFVKKETLTQLFSWEFREISKKTVFIEHLRTTVSDLLYNVWPTESNRNTLAVTFVVGSRVLSPLNATSYIGNCLRYFPLRLTLGWRAETHLALCQTSKMELFAKK